MISVDSTEAAGYCYCNEFKRNVYKCAWLLWAGGVERTLTTMMTQRRVVTTRLWQWIGLFFLARVK
jgi:hypothetical protein